MGIFKDIAVKVASGFFGVMTLLHLAVLTIRHGYSAVFGRRKIDKPGCLTDASLGEHRYMKVNDLKLHYVISGKEGKPLLLFLHGFPEFWFTWRHQIKHFQDDYRVVALDQRGYSESSKPEGIQNYTVAKLMSDIQQVILGLGYQTCVLTAHDWGGMVAWGFAHFYPDMVDKLIVMNAPSQPAMTRLLETSREQRNKSWYMYFFLLPRLPELMMASRDNHIFEVFFGEKKNDSELKPAVASEEEIEAYKYTFSQPGAWTPPINWYRAEFGPYPQAKYDMDYRMPVLLIWGVKDVNLSIDLVPLMEEQCPQIEVKRIANAGHFVQTEAPEEVSAIMAEWLKRPAEKYKTAKL